MADRNSNDLVGKLLSEGFQRTGPAAQALSDPIADTSIVVTIDELAPYEHDPRLTRNPKYEEIKASIRERGLDAPFSITRRPGETKFIVRNGGNTRLAILRELWTETKDDRFFRFHCLFRPWSSRGEIIALTGHLAENELRGGLTFIERALGIEKARELYEKEGGAALSQSELARRLTADGYPVAQPHISRMQDAVLHLLPAIPSILYGGLGRPQVEKLAGLRRAGQRIWDLRSVGKGLLEDFPSLFQDVLSPFDATPLSFSIQRVQDELVGRMAEVLDADYDTLTLEFDETEHRQRALISEPSTPPAPAQQVTSPGTSTPAEQLSPTPPQGSAQTASTVLRAGTNMQPKSESFEPPSASQSDSENSDPPRAKIAKRMGTAPLGLPDQPTGHELGEAFQSVDSVHQMDVWHIGPEMDDPHSLRSRIAQHALDVAGEAAVARFVITTEQGIGFRCTGKIDDSDGGQNNAPSRATLGILRALSKGYAPTSEALPQGGIDDADNPHSFEELVIALLGCDKPESASQRISDASLMKLFRLIRLARRLIELDAHFESTTSPLHIASDV